MPDLDRVWSAWWSLDTVGRAIAPGVTEVLSGAVDRLIGHSEHELGAGIREDLPLLTDTLQVRCAELPRLLETTQEPGRPRA